jgi:hypothetical protein
MSPSVKINSIEHGLSPTIAAEWNGLPLAIRLDSSAILKLEGNGDYRNLSHTLEKAPERISLAAQRLLEMRQAAETDGRIEVVLSALDLD